MARLVVSSLHPVIQRRHAGDGTDPGTEMGDCTLLIWIVELGVGVK
jgi:hypothetical protein